ncbi:hypothetical protein QTN25_004877 [Entamoeba marina]
MSRNTKSSRENVGNPVRNDNGTPQVVNGKPKDFLIFDSYIFPNGNETLSTFKTINKQHSSEIIDLKNRLNEVLKQKQKHVDVNIKLKTEKAKLLNKLNEKLESEIENIIIDQQKTDNTNSEVFEEPEDVNSRNDYWKVRCDSVLKQKKVEKLNEESGYEGSDYEESDYEESDHDESFYVIWQLDNENIELITENKELKEKCKKLEHANTELGGQYKILEDNCNELKCDITTISDKNLEFIDKISDLKKENERLIVEKTQLGNYLEHQKNYANGWSVAHQQLQTEFTKSRQALESEKEQLEKSLTQTKEQLKQKETALKSAQSETTQIKQLSRKDKKQVEAILAQTQRELKQTKEQLNKKNNEVTEKNTIIKRNEEDLQKLEKKFNDTTKEINEKYEKQNSHCGEQKQTIEKQRQSIREQNGSIEFLKNITNTKDEEIVKLTKKNEYLIQQMKEIVQLSEKRINEINDFKVKESCEEEKVGEMVKTMTLEKIKENVTNKRMRFRLLNNLQHKINPLEDIQPINHLQKIPISYTPSRYIITKTCQVTIPADYNKDVYYFDYQNRQELFGSSKHGHIPVYFPIPVLKGEIHTIFFYVQRSDMPNEQLLRVVVLAEQK